MDNQVAPSILTAGELAILRRLEKKPIDLRYGRNDWVPESLPRPAKRADFDRILKRNPPVVRISLGRLVLANESL